MPDALHFTGNAEADELIAAEPLALLVGFVLDQQVTVPTAFSGPLKLKQRLGRLDAAEIAGLDPDQLLEVFRQKPGIHRFPGNMSKRVQDMCARRRGGLRRRREPGLARRERHRRPEAADRGAARIRRDEGEGARVGARAALRQHDGRAARARITRCSATWTRRRRSPSTRPRSGRSRPRSGPRPGDRAPLLPRRRPDRCRHRKPGGRVPRRSAEEPRAGALRHPPPRRRGGDRQGSARSARRTEASPSGSSTTSTTPARSPCRRRLRRRPSCSRRCRSRRGRSPASPT